METDPETSDALNEREHIQIMRGKRHKTCLNQKRYFLYEHSATLWSRTPNALENVTQPQICTHTHTHTHTLMG